MDIYQIQCFCVVCVINICVRAVQMHSKSNLLHEYDLQRKGFTSSRLSASEQEQLEKLQIMFC